MLHENLRAFLDAVDTALTHVEPQKEGHAGVIHSSRDDIVAIHSLPQARMGEVLRIPDADTEAFVMQVEQDVSYALVLQGGERVREGLLIESTGKILSIPASEGFIGRVVDPLGRPIDGGKDIREDVRMPLEATAPNVMMRASVKQPVQTGILAIDALIPIGRGQRELIIGDRQTGKTAVALDAILNQKDQNVVCIYVAIGQREAKTATVVQTLQDHGAMEYTIVVSASASQPAALQYFAPYAGIALAEYFMHKGKDVLIVYDDLSKHAVAYREVSLLLRKPPGREAYPGDVFYIHSRLLERAAKLNEQYGGGSITALPIVETQAGDVSAYIPTNVISITDGQIFLESSLFHRGVRPAINIGISVSRVGSSAQTKIMKKISGTAKLDLAQYYELAAFSGFASELDAATKKQLVRGQRLVEALKQKVHQPYEIWEEVAILWAATQGYLDEVAVADVTENIRVFLQDIRARKPDLVQNIQTKRELTDEIRSELDAAVKMFFAS